MNLSGLQHIYFLGIGGIGMSALARYFLARGVRVSGYDKTETDLTTQLTKEGMQIHYHDAPDQLPLDIDLVILTPAIPKDLQEWKRLMENNIPIYKRAEVLGMISKDHICLCVAGTHGKTTTTTLLTHILKCSGVDVTAFLGGIAGNYGSNFISGNSEIVVMEADEYDRSFLQLSRKGIIVTSSDPDHLDIYGTAENMLDAYSDFINGVEKNGIVVLRSGLPLALNENVQEYAHQIFYSDQSKYRAENIRVKNGLFVFDYVGEKISMSGLEFTMPGRHNVENATAAITLALSFGATETGVRLALKDFKGIRRRFEFVLRNEKCVLIDDYAHHPAELKAAIGAARELFPTKKITGLFQPHLFSRTRDFMEGFAESLSMLDELILLDIYPARELPMEGVSSSTLLEQISTPKRELLSKEDAIKELVNRKPEVLLVLGAGDIDRLVEPLRKGLEG